MDGTRREKAMEMFWAAGALRVRDLRRAGVDTRTLQRMEDDGAIERRARGVYALRQALSDGREAMADAVVRTNGVLCLLTAAEHHGLVTLRTEETWLALASGRHPPTPWCGMPHLKLAYWSPDIINMGIEWTEMGGAQVPVTSPERTVIDLARYRHKIVNGASLALEALATLTAGPYSAQDLFDYADALGTRDFLEPRYHAVMAPRRM